MRRNKVGLKNKLVRSMGICMVLMATRNVIPKNGGVPTKPTILSQLLLFL